MYGSTEPWTLVSNHSYFHLLQHSALFESNRAWIKELIFTSRRNERSRPFRGYRQRFSLWPQLRLWLTAQKMAIRMIWKHGHGSSNKRPSLRAAAAKTALSCDSAVGDFSKRDRNNLTRERPFSPKKTPSIPKFMCNSPKTAYNQSINQCPCTT